MILRAGLSDSDCIAAAIVDEEEFLNQPQPRKDGIGSIAIRTRRENLKKAVEKFGSE